MAFVVRGMRCPVPHVWSVVSELWCVVLCRSRLYTASKANCSNVHAASAQSGQGAVPTSHWVVVGTGSSRKHSCCFCRQHTPNKLLWPPHVSDVMLTDRICDNRMAMCAHLLITGACRVLLHPLHGYRRCTHPTEEDVTCSFW